MSATEKKPQITGPVQIRGRIRETDYFEFAINRMTPTSRNRNAPTNITPFAIDPICPTRLKAFKSFGLCTFRVLTTIRMSVEMPTRTITEMKIARKITRQLSLDLLFLISGQPRSDFELSQRR
jgi:hypothetical protein